MPSFDAEPGETLPEPDTRFHRLHAALAPSYDVIETHIEAGGTVFVMHHPRASEDLIDEQAFQRDERLPYWADIWPSARVLADHVARHQGNGRRAVDIGCGSGLVACALGHAGYHVTVSDYYREALEFARLNVWRNARTDADALLLDWRRLPERLPTFHVLTAADVLYERPYGALVARTVARLLAPDGYAIIADPGRVGFEPFMDETRCVGLALVEQWEVDQMIAGERHTVRLRVFRHGAVAG